MSYFSALQQACPNIQAGLDQLWMDGNRVFAAEPAPFIQYLTSQANRTGIDMVILPGKGKVRTVEVTYKRRGLTSQKQTNIDNPKCTATGKIGNQIEEYTMDTTQNVATPGELVGLGDFDESCPPNDQIMAEKIAWHVDLLDRIVAETLAVQAAALPGKWGSAVTTTNDELQVATKKTNGDIDTTAWNTINNALRRSGQSTATPLFGGMDFNDFVELSQAGCCAADGLDVGRNLTLRGKSYAWDHYLEQALGGSEHFLAYVPGALQVLNWTSAPRKTAMGQIWSQSSDYLHTVVRSPRFGLEYDLTAKDDCGNLSMNLVATVKLIALPDDMFAVGDNYEGINGVFAAAVANPQA